MAAKEKKITPSLPFPGPCRFPLSSFRSFPQLETAMAETRRRLQKRNGKVAPRWERRKRKRWRGCRSSNKKKKSESQNEKKLFLFLIFLFFFFFLLTRCSFLPPPLSVSTKGRNPRRALRLICLFSVRDYRASGGKTLSNHSAHHAKSVY